MTNPIRTLLSGLSVVALVATTPVTTHAQSHLVDAAEARATVSQFGGAPGLRDDLGLPMTPLPERLGNVPVDIEISRVDASQCRYVSHVQGRLRVLRTRAVTPRAERLVYRPHLTVSSQLRCPGAPIQTLSVRRMSGGQYTPGQLERAISGRAAAVAAARGQTCRYAPTYAFDAGRLVSTGVTESCGYARGGGPRR